MTQLNCNSLCRLLCCPPLPSRIAAKLAFLPPEPSYALTKKSDDAEFTYKLSSYVMDIMPNFDVDKIDMFAAKSKRGNTLAFVYMHTNPYSKMTFLLSHGNAVDIGLMLNFMHDLSSKLNVNIMCYDYSGYGESTGKPLEKNLYADAECAIKQLQTKYEVPLDQIVLYGQSIGTVPTVYLATKYRVAAVVLHSPLLSGIRVPFPEVKKTYCCDVFPNIVRTPNIISPTLVIHGTLDEVININHGESLFQALPQEMRLPPLFIPGAGHNDCETFPAYLMRLLTLVRVELPTLIGTAQDYNGEMQRKKSLKKSIFSCLKSKTSPFREKILDNNEKRIAIDSPEEVERARLRKSKKVNDIKERSVYNSTNTTESSDIVTTNKNVKVDRMSLKSYSEDASEEQVLPPPPRPKSDKETELFWSLHSRLSNSLPRSSKYSPPNNNECKVEDISVDVMNCRNVRELSLPLTSSKDSRSSNQLDLSAISNSLLGVKS